MSNILNHILESKLSLASLPDIYYEEIKFIIVIATYFRKDNSTLLYVNRCLDSIKSQRYKNWEIYLIGDNYENEEELYSYKKLVDESKIKIFNKQNPERDHINNKFLLWNIAGAGAMNYGLNLGRENGYKYYVHLDDDDYWDINHLLVNAYVFKEYQNCIFTFTRSTYPMNEIYRIPIEEINSIFPNNLLPRSCNVIHSSICFRMDIIKCDYYTTLNESEIFGPSDAIMWDLINNFINNNNEYNAIHIPILTTYHDEENIDHNS